MASMARGFNLDSPLLPPGKGRQRCTAKERVESGSDQTYTCLESKDMLLGRKVNSTLNDTIKLQDRNLELGG